MSYITSRSCEAKEVITKLADFLIEYELGYAEKMFLKLCMVLFYFNLTFLKFVIEQFDHIFYCWIFQRDFGMIMYSLSITLCVFLREGFTISICNENTSLNLSLPNWASKL